MTAGRVLSPSEAKQNHIASVRDWLVRAFRFSPTEAEVASAKYAGKWIKGHSSDPEPALIARKIARIVHAQETKARNAGNAAYRGEALKERQRRAEHMLVSRWGYTEAQAKRVVAHWKKLLIILGLDLESAVLDMHSWTESSPKRARILGG